LFSLAGGVGKTTLATNIGRILSGHGLRVVLANWGRAFAFQHLMNSRAQTVGSLSFIHPPNSENAPPMILIECGELAAGGEGSEALRLVEQASGHADVTLLDLPVSLGATTYGLLLQSDHVIVPLLPDVQSVATLQLLEEVLVTQGSPGPEAHYVINRYQASRSLHRETFDRLRDKLGDQLMPNYVRESPEIQDAMWSGVTVVDHAPTSTVAVDLHALAGSVRQLTPRRSVRKGSIA
jgi:cellulose biosynthesis protein BcsQ